MSSSPHSIRGPKSHSAAPADPLLAVADVWPLQLAAHPLASREAVQRTESLVRKLSAYRLHESFLLTQHVRNELTPPSYLVPSGLTLDDLSIDIVRLSHTLKRFSKLDSAIHLSFAHLKRLFPGQVRPYTKVDKEEVNTQERSKLATLSDRSTIGFIIEHKHFLPNMGVTRFRTKVKLFSYPRLCTQIQVQPDLLFPKLYGGQPIFRDSRDHLDLDVHEADLVCPFHGHLLLIQAIFTFSQRVALSTFDAIRGEHDSRCDSSLQHLEVYRHTTDHDGQETVSFYTPAWDDLLPGSKPINSDSGLGRRCMVARAMEMKLYVSDDCAKTEFVLKLGHPLLRVLSEYLRRRDVDGFRAAFEPVVQLAWTAFSKVEGRALFVVPDFSGLAADALWAVSRLPGSRGRTRSPQTRTQEAILKAVDILARSPLVEKKVLVEANVFQVIDRLVEAGVVQRFAWGTNGKLRFFRLAGPISMVTGTARWAEIFDGAGALIRLSRALPRTRARRGDRRRRKRIPPAVFPTALLAA